MRKILFRGKRKDNGKWIHGSLAPKETNSYADGFLIINGAINYDELDNYQPLFSAYSVIPKTVGQYTGLADKNGIAIFEGDIVQYSTYFNCLNCQSIVKFGKYRQDGSDGEYTARNCLGFYVEINNFTCPDWYNNEPESFHDYLKQQSLAEIASQCQVIGNIYDNPELLKVEE